MLDALNEWLSNLFAVDEQTVKQLLTTALAIAALWLGRRIVLRAVKRQTDDVRVRYRWAKVSTYVVFAIAVPLIVLIWVADLGSLGTFVGLVSAGLVVALRDLILNMAGWVYIFMKRPIFVGDRIQVNEHAGDVVDFSLLQFTILEIGNWVDADQSTGRIIHLPNRLVFETAMANYTHGFPFIWNEINVLITFESNWRKLKRLLSEIADEHVDVLNEKAQRSVREAASRYMIFYRNLTPVVYTDVKADGVQLTLRYLCEPRRRRGIETAVWEAILDNIEREPDLELAYPTVRYYTRNEGRPGQSD
ncbi:MAG TPA: mechanosensitive ion channel family protein [Rhodothermales bacterium]|nr:mechanosensitive ion channel family protein [Rhodothermales bacterium]